MALVPIEKAHRPAQKRGVQSNSDHVLVVRAQIFRRFHGRVFHGPPCEGRE